jgi:regulator of replication initiation timing
MLDDLQFDQIADPQVREVIRRLMNLVEQLSAENQQLREENQRLRDENNCLKGEQGQPTFPKARPKPTDHSSEAERRVPRGRVKQAKNATIPIDREETQEVDPDLLPPDAEFKGYEEVIVQDVTFHTDNVRFFKEKWYSPSQQRIYLADLPTGYDGQFGPTLKALIWIWYFASQMTEPKIAEFLHHLGIQISEGQISNLLIKQQDERHAEKAAIAEAAIAASPWQQTDDTATRVNGKAHHCHVISNPLASVYYTLPGKDRLSVLDALRNQRPRTYLLNTEADAYLDRMALSAGVRRNLVHLPRDIVLDETTLTALLAQHVANAGPRQQTWIREAMTVAAYHAEVEFPVIRLLLCDDAPQFVGLTEELALCWVHDGRFYKKLRPRFGVHLTALSTFERDYWAFYRALLAYRQQPTAAERVRLSTVFDTLFARVTGYDDLDARIAKTQAKKDALLLVLVHPEIPLHNNASELACRARVRKRDVSNGPRTAEGAKAWDTGMTIVETAKKLGVSFYAYIHDRISGAMQLPALADLITERAKSLNLGASWAEPDLTPIY